MGGVCKLSTDIDGFQEFIQEEVDLYIEENSDQSVFDIRIIEDNIGTIIEFGYERMLENVPEKSPYISVKIIQEYVKKSHHRLETQLSFEDVRRVVDQEKYHVSAKDIIRWLDNVCKEFSEIQLIIEQGFFSDIVYAQIPATSINKYWVLKQSYVEAHDELLSWGQENNVNLRITRKNLRETAWNHRHKECS